MLQLSGMQMSSVIWHAGPSPKNTPPKHLEYDKWHVIDYLVSFTLVSTMKGSDPANMHPTPTPSPWPRCINIPPLYGDSQPCTITTQTHSIPLYQLPIPKNTLYPGPPIATPARISEAFPIRKYTELTGHIHTYQEMHSTSLS